MSTTSADDPAPASGAPGASAVAPPSGTSAGSELDRVLAEGAERARDTAPAQTTLWDAVTQATRGGKRFRPALVAAAFEALADRSEDVAAGPDAVAAVGAAIELLHTAFVVHDDVIDGDDVRRGRPNVSGTFTSAAVAEGASTAAARHCGMTAGILAGDLALAAAIRTVATCPADTATVHRLLDLFDRALHTTAAGELADVRFALGTSVPSLSEALTMEEQKTSAYSFALPLQAGAVIAGAGEDTVRCLGEVGRMLGIAFQLTDDLLGVFGDPAETGKSVLTDLREGKQTPLIAHARTTAQWEAIALHHGSADLAEEHAATVRGLLVESGSRRFVEELADDYVRGARELLDEIDVPLDRLGVLAMLATEIGERAA